MASAPINIKTFASWREDTFGEQLLVEKNEGTNFEVPPQECVLLLWAIYFPEGSLFINTHSACGCCGWDKWGIAARCCPCSG